MKNGTMTVGDVADLVGVSVRTLHHWEDVGLIAPASRSATGYRLYDATDVERIHQILVYRETGMQLSDIAEVMTNRTNANGAQGSPGPTALEHLARQRQLLMDRIARLQEMVLAVDTMMEKKKMGIQLSPEEQVEVFGTEWDPNWENEARETWDDQQVWGQYTERTAKLTKADYKRIAAKINETEARLAEAKREGIQPGSDRANDLAEEHRASLNHWFNVSHARQVLLARMYVADPRFAKHYNDYEPGLTAWLLQIVEANAQAHGLDMSRVEW